MTKVPKLLTFTDTYWQLLTVADSFWQLLILTGTYRHLKTHSNNDYTFTNASTDEFEEKGRHNDDPDPDGKKPNE